MNKLLNATLKARETDNSKKSNAMSIDEPSDESSLSVVRLFSFPLSGFLFSHLVLVPHCVVYIIHFCFLN